VAKSEASRTSSWDALPSWRVVMDSSQPVATGGAGGEVVFDDGGVVAGVEVPGGAPDPVLVERRELHRAVVERLFGQGAGAGVDGPAVQAGGTFRGGCRGCGRAAWAGRVEPAAGEAPDGGEVAGAVADGVEHDAPGGVLVGVADVEDVAGLDVDRIYPELARLAEEGLIEPAAEGARGRRSYGITDAGRAELRAWLLAPRTGGAVRNEPVLRLFLLSALEPDDARTVLLEIAENSRRRLAELEQAMAADAPASPDGRLPFGWLAAGYGLRQYQASHDWATWALDQLDKAQPANHDPAAAPHATGRSR
jgi:DNA-binding PadR family transcriptional regulator